MTDKKELAVTEGNCLIAEFNGYVYFPDDSLNGIKGVYRKTDWMPMLPIDFRYHSSWELLMPVVGKISKGVTIREFDIDYELLEEDGDAGKIMHLRICADIETVWQAVLEFIQWYNNQTPTK